LLSLIVLVLWLNNSAVIAQDKFLWKGNPNQPTSWTNPENWQNHLAPKPGSAVIIEQQLPNQQLFITNVPAGLSLSQLQIKMKSGGNFTVILQPEKPGSNFIIGEDNVQNNYALDIPAGATLVLKDPEQYGVGRVLKGRRMKTLFLSKLMAFGILNQAAG
jgi:hypothetical protein